MKIAIACEITPGKTIIPIIKRIMEKDLGWGEVEFIGLTHGEGVDELLKPFCSELYNIGSGRRSVKRGRLKLFYLIAMDIIKAFNALRGKNIDILISCGNAGDVRKSIIAANILKIPVLHIEQDIYNPIEVISFANIITAPSKEYEDYLSKEYGLNNVINIGGYPMASYVNDFINEDNLKSKEEILKLYFKNDSRFNQYILLVLGGDLKEEDLPELFNKLQIMDYPIAIAPYRFDKGYIKSLSIKKDKSNLNIMVLDNFVDILSLMNCSKLTIFGAGMGITIEAGVLNIPSIKIAGFHKDHGSVDLARSINIPILEIENLPENLPELFKHGEDSYDLLEYRQNLLEDGLIAIDNIIAIIDNFKSLGKKGGFEVMWRIWKKRSMYR
jgi:UDP-N-acetylglucosamine:LPS N-acetylglucosamine transferase